ncbi:NlpC/P60 family protein [Streptomyces sp. SCSIO 30461]|uniref:C40 family peptidase n=1 Tax=Streptomyces sp. SCSIO 30461 TaxID=3118085 RepID=UPI0030D38E89
MASHRRSTPSSGLSGFPRGARGTLLSAAAATAAAALGAAPAGAEPHGTTAAAPAQEQAAPTRAKVDRLYEQAERATEAYNAAGERVDRLRSEVAAMRDRAARGQERVNTMRGALGAVAGAQYRSGGIDPALALLLSDDPDSYLGKAELLGRIGDRQSAALRDLRRARHTLARERAEAGRKLVELEENRAAVARHKRMVEAKLAEARRMLNALPSAERDGPGRASRSGWDGLPADLSAGPASARAATAVTAAKSALGRPYVWGASGPNGFDCSGLMQWSYAQAGVGLPRTSQAQRHAGRKVPLSEARPGDLVTYRSDASHVAMYVGNGQVVHAPYPGAAVRYDPVGMMPIASVTRP